MDVCTAQFIGGHLFTGGGLYQVDPGSKWTWATPPFPQVHHIAVVIGYHLDLDMAGGFHISLGIHLVVSERAQGLPFGQQDGLIHVIQFSHDVHGCPAKGTIIFPALWVPTLG